MKRRKSEAGKKNRTGGRSGAARIYESTQQPRPVEHERAGSFPWRLALPLLLILAGFAAFSLVGRRPDRVVVAGLPGGDPEAGRRAIQSWGCGACHTIPGIPGAYGKVGPELDQMAEQAYIAGMLPNTPENLIRWIMDPQEIQPGNAMPDTDVNEVLARDMAAYLYSLR